jgi:hypothetical protein
LILLDTSGLLAAVDASQRHHAAAARTLAEARAPRLLSPFVLAELDYLLGARVGASARLALLSEVAGGAYQLEAFSAGDLEAARALMAKFADADLGLADASIAVLADRHGTGDVLTLDERHFRALRSPTGRAFRLLPADSAS